MMGAVFQYFAEVTGEKVTAAQARAVARGVLPNSRIVPGYVRGEDGVLVVVPELAPSRRTWLLVHVADGKWGCRADGPVARGSTARRCARFGEMRDATTRSTASRVRVGARIVAAASAERCDQSRWFGGRACNR